MEDDFALRYVRIYPVINSRAELATLAPGGLGGKSITIHSTLFFNFYVRILWPKTVAWQD